MHGSMVAWPTGPCMEPCGCPSIATVFFFFILEASDVPWKLETEKTGTVNYTLANSLYTS